MPPILPRDSRADPNRPKRHQPYGIWSAALDAQRLTLPRRVVSSGHTSHFTTQSFEHHVHPPRLGMERFQPMPTISKQNHSPEDLVRALRLMNKTLNERQKSSKLRFELFENGSRSLLKTNADLQAYFQIFDDLFFKGHLGEFCAIRFQNEPKLEGSKVLGYALSQIDSSGNFTSVSIVVARRMPLNGSPLAAMRRGEVLTTLLHEMAHAYLQYYCCRNSDHAGCVNRYEAQVGQRGHREAWQDVANIIQESAENVLGGVWNLGQAESIALDRQSHEIGW